jgi:hypothetical protein
MFVDQFYVQSVAHLFRQYGGDLQASESGAENDDAGFHVVRVYV